MLTRLGGIAAIALSLVLLSGCGRPYDDGDLASSFKGSSNVTTAKAGCNNIELGWECRSKIGMSPDASDTEIAKVITGAAGLLSTDRGDSAKVTVGLTKIRGSSVEFSTKPQHAAQIARAMRASLDLNESVKSEFTQANSAMTLTMDLTSGSFDTFTADTRRIFEASNADRLTFAVHKPDVTGVTKRGAWPTAEIATLNAIRKTIPITSARINDGILTVVVGSPQDVNAARAIAAGVKDSGTIGFLDISADAASNFTQTDPDTLRRLGPAIEEARAQPGFGRIQVERDTMTIRVASVKQARAIDNRLGKDFPSAYRSVEVAYDIPDVLRIQRNAGGTLWWDSAQTLIDSRLFSQIGISYPESAGTGFEVELTGVDRTPTKDLARAIARSWQPDQKSRITLTWMPSADLLTATWDSAEKISVVADKADPAASRTAFAQLESGWAAGR